MKRIALRTAAVAASAAVLALSCGGPRLASASSVTVLEVGCLYPGEAELSAPVRMTAQDGTAVELWCGDRVELSGGTCRVRRGEELTAVPCVRRPMTGTAVGAGRPGGR